MLYRCKLDTNFITNTLLLRNSYYEDTSNSPVETGLFWLSSRYYSPELCRIISPDDVSYLNPNSVNGLNLYCYCGNDPINYYDPSGHFAVSALIVTLSLLLATMISAAVVAVKDDNTNILGSYKGFSGPELSFSDKLRLSLISCDTYLAKKESNNRDSLNGYTYFKFLNAGLNIGFTKKNKNKEKNKLLDYDLRIFEFGYTNDYFSISLAPGLDPIDVSLDLENIFKLLF